MKLKEIIFSCPNLGNFKCQKKKFEMFFALTSNKSTLKTFENDYNMHKIGS